MPQFFELSHEIENGMTTFEGQPAPVIESYAERGGVYDTRFRFDENTLAPPSKKISMVDSTGTLIDTPFYSSKEGHDVAEINLESVAGIDAIIVRCHWESFGRRIEPTMFSNLDIANKAVLFCTGWSNHWRSFKYFKGWPYLSEKSAQELVDRGAKIVGIDSLNIDITDDGRRPVHQILHKANISIISHMTGLEHVPETGTLFYSVPLKVPGCGSFPVRAFCMSR